TVITSARCLTAASNAAAKSCGFGTSNTWGWMPSALAALSTSLHAARPAGLLMLNKAVTRVTRRTGSLSHSSRFQLRHDCAEAQPTPRPAPVRLSCSPAALTTCRRDRDVGERRILLRPVPVFLAGFDVHHVSHGDLPFFAFGRDDATASRDHENLVAGV